MKGTLFFFFAIAIFISASNAKAQSTRLSEAEYNSALAQALEGASGINRRVITEEKFYSGPTLTGMRNIVSEFAGPDAKRVEVTEDFVQLDTHHRHDPSPVSEPAMPPRRMIYRPHTQGASLPTLPRSRKVRAGPVQRCQETEKGSG